MATQTVKEEELPKKGSSLALILEINYYKAVSYTHLTLPTILLV